MSRIVVAVVVVTALIGATGCSESRRRDTCSDTVGFCEDEGVTRCSRESDAIEICAANDSDCTVWTPQSTCGGPGTCALDDGAPSCFCDDTCGEDEARCRGDVIEICEESDAGCWYWAEDDDCGARDLSCDDSLDPPQCASGCSDECDEGGRRCLGRTIQGCESDESDCTAWQDVLDCGEAFCVEEGEGAYCSDTCEDQCPMEGVTSCDGDQVVSCESDAEGCLAWDTQDDCRIRGLECVDADGGAFCDCPFACELDDARCDGDTLQACTFGEGGCWVWDDVVDCASLGLACDDIAGSAGCDNGGGDGCDDALVLWDFPVILTGGGFSADFTDAQSFGHDSCQQRADSPEVIFVVDVEAGGIIYMSERGDINVTFSVQAACDPLGECLFSVDRGEADGFYFEPETPGRYYIIAEAFEDILGDYELIISMLYPEECDNGIDDDHNGRIDCDDPACFGDPTHCGTELNCEDGEDNDADGEEDCDDADCVASPWCADYQGIWELFGEGDLPDISGQTITFTPDATAADGYRWSATGGVADFPVAAGSGVLTSSLTLGDDDAARWPLTEMSSFAFYGIDYNEVFISSNGMVTFGEADTTWEDLLNNHFGQPGVSGLRFDINPPAGGTITVDESARSLAVTYEDVLRYNSSQTATFQIVLFADGSIAVTILDLTLVDGLIGITSGVGRGDYPPETDFVIPPPEDCADGVDNDFDGDVDCSDSDCFGVAPCDVEALCDDGLDNDGDGSVDCDDLDCAGPACEPYHGYWERFGDGSAPDMEGRIITFTPDAVNPEGYSWARTGLGGAGFPITPGTGLPSTALDLVDDDFQEVALTLMSGFPFYGTTYTEIFVSSNGYVTFGAGSATAENEPWNHFALPSVAGYRRDLYESDSDVLTVDEFDDHVAITWEGAEGYAGPNDFQIVLWDSGVIDLTYVDIPIRFRVSGLLGISNGMGNGTWPAETNFVP